MKTVVTLSASFVIALGAVLIAQDTAAPPATDFGKPPKPADPVAPKLEQGQKWIFAFANFAKDDRTQELTDLVKRGHKAGYNGILVSDVKFDKLQLTDDAYKKRLQAFRKVCRDEQVKIAVHVGAYGYSDMFLTHDRNLAEGMPVRDATFIVKGGKLVPFDETTRLVNGSFEDVKDGQPVGWQLDGAGTTCIIDEKDKTDGKVSLCMKEAKKAVRAQQKVKLQPWHYYIISAKCKTQKWPPREIRLQAVAPAAGALNAQEVHAEKTMDWKTLYANFDSQDATEATIQFGNWAPDGGTGWFDDCRIEPGGFINIIRRDDLPLKVTSEDGKTIYEEGKDFSKVEDPKYLNDPNPGYFTIGHEQPTVTIPAGSKLKEGQKVLASYHFASEAGKAGQMNVCMAEPKVFDLLKEQAQWMKDNVDPDVYFMGYDEIRHAGWDDSCVKSGKTPGELLADSVRKLTEIIKEVAPGKPIATWNDMFDPYHNASPTARHYYLVKGVGPWAKSWEGLSPDVVIFNWRQNKVEGLKFFADRGHQQILAGYYDKDPARIVEWLKMGKDLPGIIGVMYTTWVNKYDQLEDFAKAADSVARP
ncbi:MAG: hypothetical protein ACE15C_06545 [Phycisphaerae bacterium]